MADVTNVNQDNQNSEGSPEAGSSSAAKLPLRGLAMILIAVAVLLALWGLYSMTREDSADTASGLAEESDLISTTQDPTSLGSESEEPDGSEPAQATSPESEESEESEAPADNADKDKDADRPAPGEKKPAGAAEGAGQAPTAPARLNILNNSTVPNLAADVAATLDDDGYNLGEVGNLATQILPENTVYFQPGNKDAEQRARKLADKVDGVAREYDSQLPAETDGSNDITLVLVRQVAL